MEAGVQGQWPRWPWGWRLHEEEPQALRSSPPSPAAFASAPSLPSVSVASGRTASRGLSWPGPKEAGIALTQWSCPQLGFSLYRATRRWQVCSWGSTCVPTWALGRVPLKPYRFVSRVTFSLPETGPSRAQSSCQTAVNPAHGRVLRRPCAPSQPQHAPSCPGPPSLPHRPQPSPAFPWQTLPRAPCPLCGCHGPQQALVPAAGGSPACKGK